MLNCVGYGCFNQIAKSLVEDRNQIAIICCCARRAAQPACLLCRHEIQYVRRRLIVLWRRRAAHDGTVVGVQLPRRHHELARCDVCL